MGWFNEQSIRSKLARAFLLTSGISLAIAGAAFVAHDVVSFRTGTVQSLSTLVRVVAENSTAPLSFADPQAARDTLDGLRAEPSIVYAAIFQPDGRVFAEYRPAGAAPAPGPISHLSASPWDALPAPRGAQGHVFHDGGVDVYKEIRHLGESLGLIVIRADLQELVTRLYWDMAGLAAMLATAAGAAFLVAGRLRRKIADPILALESAMLDFSRNRNKNAFVQRSDDDEIGRLVDGFNTMVGEIRARDAKLEEAMRELSLAKDSAESANAAKSRYLATLTHEIRGPMTGVVAMSDLLAAGGANESQIGYARIIRRSAEQLLEFVNNVLDYSKVESGRMTLEVIEFSLTELIDGVIDAASASACARGIELRKEVSGNVPSRILGDPVRLKQILANLVGNAVKFTEQGSVTLRVAPVLDARHDGALALRVRFEVIDTGIGIAQDAQAHLFEAFRQADESTTRRFGGSGLGLAISKELVELMHGQIGVRSQLGCGSTFWFDVALAPSPVAGDAASRPATLAPESPTVSIRALTGKRILVAEDCRLNQEVASTVLRHFKCKVDVVEDGAKAVRAAAAVDYDLILMDWQMPALDGLAAAAAIRDHEQRRGSGRVPIVLATATAQRLAADAAAAAVDDYLPKPYRIPEVAQMLNRWIPADPTADVVPPPAAFVVQESSGQLIDESAWDTIRALQSPGRPGLLKAILELFVSHSQVLMDELKDGWQQQDAIAVFRAAHAIRSISLNAGAAALASLCGALELQAKNQRWDAAREIYGRVIECHRDTCVALAEYRGIANAQPL